MNPVFADTAYYLAFINDKDELHALAVDATAHLQRRMVTTTWVLTELADPVASLPCRCGSRHAQAKQGIGRHIATVAGKRSP